ncbi:hypothetical protein [Acinetobacter celticus]|uniref:Uncharacterized protein n=1 Tax=Acinetobacter celticus TaxID=1891224 RepID=A0A1C3CUM7_9GAMM|nr:hypothetical protein [Acinetobacter celticus]ODA12439.1 hypothetical protein BBP83_11160 [Acinetobacter celticus]
MQKFINNDFSDIRYFEDSVIVSNWIDLSKYRLMTNAEILKHETPKPSIFHTEWNGTEWIDIRTEEEQLQYKRSQYPTLTRYQFLRCLLENGYKSSNIEAQILTIEDEFTRELTLLGFKEATNFVRTDESVIAMQSILNLDDDQVDAMWLYALTL